MLKAAEPWTHGPGCEGCDCEGLDVGTASLQGRLAIERSPPNPELALLGDSRSLRKTLARMEPGQQLLVQVLVELM